MMKTEELELAASVFASVEVQGKAYIKLEDSSTAVIGYSKGKWVYSEGPLWDNKGIGKEEALRLMRYSIETEAASWRERNETFNWLERELVDFYRK